MNSKLPVPERLLDVAADMFARVGFDAVSVRKITSRAKANLGAITYYFGSKEALFHAVIDRAGGGLVQRVEAIAADESTAPLDRVARIAEMLMIEPNLPAPALLLRALTTDRPLPPPLVCLMQRNIKALTTLIQQGQADGSIRPGDSSMLALSVISQPFLLRMAKRIPRDVFGVNDAHPTTQRQLVAHVVTTVTRSLASAPSPL